MASIQHVHRRGAVYWWRRRFPFGDGRTGTLRVEVSLRTRCPRAARRIAAEVTCACERLKGRRPGEMLTPVEMRRVLASVARRHAAKLDAVAAVETAEGRAPDAARRTELAMGWAMRMLAAHGTQADIDPGFADEMLASGLDRETMALAFQFVAEHHRSGLSKPKPARLERLLEELDIDPSPGNLAQSRRTSRLGRARPAPRASMPAWSRRRDL